jgi:hypothetical protein
MEAHFRLVLNDEIFSAFLCQTPRTRSSCRFYWQMPALWQRDSSLAYIFVPLFLRGLTSASHVRLFEGGAMVQKASSSRASQSRRIFGIAAILAPQARCLATMQQEQPGLASFWLVPTILNVSTTQSCSRRRFSGEPAAETGLSLHPVSEWALVIDHDLIPAPGRRSRDELD